jgi:hypothetical protein
MDRIELISSNDLHDAAPESFVQRLLSFDKDLYVTWNKNKNRWVIEQCIEHHSGRREHDHTCKRIYVWLVQDSEGDMMPLCDRVFDKLGEMRKFTDQFGDGPKSIERFLKFTEECQAKLDSTRDRKMREMARDNSKDNKRQLGLVRDLMMRHDMRPNRY